MEKKTVLITGASRGIGAECARTFAKSGYNVVIGYNKSEAQAKKVQEECESLGARVLALQADMSNFSDIEEMVKKAVFAFGKIDVLVNNAGISLSKLIIDTSNDELLKVINTNLNGMIVASREVVKDMLKRGTGGKIINISSMWGQSGASMETVYSASKAGVIGFTQGLAKEVGIMGINVNAVAPGVIMTDMMKSYTDDEINELKNCTALSRLGEPKDVAEVVLFLACSKADYITGQCITVDGGFC